MVSGSKLRVCGLGWRVRTSWGAVGLRKGFARDFIVCYRV